MKSTKFLLAALLAITTGQGWAGPIKSAPISDNIGPILNADPYPGVATVRIAGATTYRAPVHKAITDVLDNSGVPATHVIKFAYNSSTANNLYGASQAWFHGFLKSNGAEVIFKTSFTGSVAGAVDVSAVNNLTNWVSNNVSTQNFPTDNAINGPATEASDANGVNGASGSPPNVAMSDSFLDSVTKSISTAGTVGKNFATQLTAAFTPNNTNGKDTIVGIVPFVWVAGKQASGSPPFTNITQQAALQLESAGNIPAIAMAGSSSAAQYDYVFLVGRNEDSGSRVCGLAEPGGIGSTANGRYGQSALQYVGSFSSNQATQGASGGNPALPEGGVGSSLTGLGLWTTAWNVNTIPTLTWNTEGHSGWNGGGDLANMLSATNPVTGLNMTGIDGGDGEPAGFDTNGAGTSKAYLVGYLGVADAIKGGSLAAPAGVPGGTVLSYNGVPYSVANVQKGSYTFWAFEHLLYRITGSNAVSGTSRTAADDLANKILTADAPTNSSGVTDPTQAQLNSAGILFDTNVLFSRNREGTQVGPVY